MDIKTGLHCEAVERHGFLSANQQRLGYMSDSVIIASEWPGAVQMLMFFSHIIQKKKKITQLNTKCSLHYL